MKNQFLFLLLAVALVLFTGGCASLTGFEEGRTLDQDVSELSFSGNFTRVPDLFDDDELDSININSAISFPNLELTYKRGFTEKLDVGIRVNTNFNGSIFVKHQVVGDQTSAFALSPGLEIGTVLGAAFNVGIPLYMSYYPTDEVAINFTPRFMYQIITGTAGSGASYLGGNFGVLFGRKNKFGLDVGYYRVGISAASEPLFTFGIGGKFRFGGSESSSRN